MLFDQCESFVLFPKSDICNVNKIIPDITHDEIVDSIKLELQSWFPEVDFDFIKLYEIPNALPRHTPSEFNRMRNIPQGENGVYSVSYTNLRAQDTREDLGFRIKL